MDLLTKLKLINNYLENECANIQWREMMTEYQQYLMSFKAEAKPRPDDQVTRRQILEEAITAVCTDRNHQYGGRNSPFPPSQRCGQHTSGAPVMTSPCTHTMSL